MNTPTNIANCWEKCVRKDDITEDETKLILFPKQETKAACDALGWIEVDAETLVAQHFSEEYSATSVNQTQLTDVEPLTQEVTQEAIVMVLMK
jgi:hypothetical protein